MVKKTHGEALALIKGSSVVLGPCCYHLWGSKVVNGHDKAPEEGTTPCSWGLVDFR